MMMRSVREYLAKRGYTKDDDGSIIVFVMVVFSAMFLVGGTAVDLARHENLRSSLQYNLDRAVLAAASLKQTQHPTVVVNDYMSKVITNEEFTVNVQSTVNVNSRSVDATANANLDTWFLSMAGIEVMPISARSKAEERIPNLEISLVLDVSGSMSGTKLANLKVAAKEFVTTMLGNTDPDTVSISLVPFNHNVAPSLNMFNALTIAQEHSLSTCLDFADSAFGSTAIDPTVSQNQQMFTSYYDNPDDSDPDHYGGTNSNSRTCYPDSWFEILPHGSNETALHNKIDGLQAGGWTSGHLGMKWGLALLDPAFQPVLTTLIGDGDVAAGFAGAPVDWTDPDTMKVVVMMGDGANTYEFRLGNGYSGTGSNMWEVVTEEPGQFTHLTYYGHTYQASDYADGWLEQYCSWSSTTCYYGDPVQVTTHYLKHESAGTYLNLDDFSTITSTVFDLIQVGLPLVSGGNPVQQKQQISWGEAWGLMSAEWYDDNAGGSAQNDLLTATGRSYGESDTVMASACTAARDAGIVVYTIGYETNDTTSAKLRDCATTSAHYYDASGTQISTVFAAIAAGIQKLKLTQ